jgi:hypothetical protein
MHAEFARAPLERRHVLEAGEGDAEAAAAAVLRRVASGAARYPR